MTFRNAYKRVLQDARVTQAEAAKICGVRDQPAVNRIISGNITLARMYQLLAPFGYHVEISNGESSFRCDPAERK